MRRSTIFRLRRIVAVVAAACGLTGFLVLSPKSWEYQPAEGASGEAGSEVDGVASDTTDGAGGDAGERLATEVLGELEVKGRAPKTGYARTEFYDNWPNVDGCSLRQKIIQREFGESAVLEGCNVVSGEYFEPYTGQVKQFGTRAEISKGIQIDHIVALSDAWQKGAQYQTKEARYALATDPLNLIAVDAAANQQKSDGDAATWLPANKAFRCQYVARQVSVKRKYGLWVTAAEKEAILRVLNSCPEMKVPVTGIF